MAKNKKYENLTREEKILGYWKTLAIAALENDLKLAMKAVFALKALGVPPYEPVPDDIELIPIDPDESNQDPML